MKSLHIFLTVCIALFGMLLPSSVRACVDCGQQNVFRSGRVVDYELVIAGRTLSPAGRRVEVLTVNGTLPGPVLRFHVGDTARIRVRNELASESTSVHWHGLLLPNAQDGVPGVTTPPIVPGGSHTFEFVLRHAGTYWYHSHTHLQEQRGVYGAIVVLPRVGEPVPAADRTDREEVLVLSDWTNESPDEVMRTLARGSDYYSLQRGSAQSLWGAWRAGGLRDFLEREWSKMPPMDVADVAYDSFLINGRSRLRLDGRPGERVRLRIVNAAASTYFYLHWSAGPLRIIEADGMPVEPVDVPRLLMGTAETYDVVVTIPDRGEWEFRATAMDGSGHASAVVGHGDEHPASDPPKPKLYVMDEMMDLAIAMQDDDPRASLALPRPGPPYPLLRAREDTTLPVKAPRRELTMHLTGDMGRYSWSFDGKTMAQEGVVTLHHGEVVRLELVNDTMMHHPIHLHGHFFRVLNGQGARAPLKHTVDVPPMSRRTIEFEANERHAWLFHCHLLYHMMSGMGRVFRYEESTPAAAAAHALTEMEKSHAAGLGEHAHDPWLAWGEGAFLSSMTGGEFNLRHGRHDWIAEWEAGWSGVPDVEYEVDLVHRYYLNPDWQIWAGVRLTNEDGADDRAVAGFQYRLPLRLQAGVGVDSEGHTRLTLAQQWPLTSRLSAFGQMEYDTASEEKWTAGLSLIVTKKLSLTSQFHSEYGWGAGVSIRF